MNSLIVPITDLRRNFGGISSNLAFVDHILLTKGGRPYAILKVAPEEKRKLLVKSFGAWKGTELDNEKLWKEVFTRKSRKGFVKL